MAGHAERVTRILTMIPYIREHQGVPLKQLADYLGTTPGTVLADMDVALMCGVPPYLPNDYVGVYLEEDRVYVGFADHFKRPVRLSLQEALSLKLALRSLPTAARGAVSRLTRRIDSMLSRATRRGLSRQESRLRLGRSTSSLAKKMRRIERALTQNRVLEISYYTASRDAMTERRVRPYGVIDHEGFWYLVAHCEMRGRELPFRVDRMRTIELTDDTFEVPADFDLRRYRRAEMYFPTRRDVIVTVRVDAEVARWVEEEFPGKYINRRADGSLLLKLPTSKLDWVLTWALQRGEAVEVLGPPAARRRMGELCQATLANYK